MTDQRVVRSPLGSEIDGVAAWCDAHLRLNERNVRSARAVRIGLRDLLLATIARSVP